MPPPSAARQEWQTGIVPDMDWLLSAFEAGAIRG